jgi:DNA-binding LacI/PurR family transcriptional regulator
MALMEAVGLVLVEESRTDGAFTAAVVHGLEERLIPFGVRVTTRVVRTLDAEIDAYRSWARTGVIDAVVLLGVVKRDPRIALLREIGLQFVVATDVQLADGFSAVVFDNAAMARSLLRYLVGRGCERILYLPGSHPGDVSDLRAAAVADHGPGIAAEVLRTELEPDVVVAAVQAARPARESGPLALVFDDDDLTVAVIDSLRTHGLGVPGEVAVVCWTDSVLCQSSDPAVTAVNGRADEVGTLLGECLFRATSALSPVVLTAPPPFVVARATT